MHPFIWSSFSDASSASAARIRSQLGFVILLADGKKHEKIIHFGSTRCHNVSQLIIPEEVHALVHAFDSTLVHRKALEELLNRPVEVEAILDSRRLFNVIAKNSSRVERRLQINVCTLREICKKRNYKGLNGNRPEKKHLTC